MVGADIEREMRSSPHEGPNDMFNMFMAAMQKMTETMVQQVSDTVVKGIHSMHSYIELSSGNLSERKVELQKRCTDNQE